MTGKSRIVSCPRCGRGAAWSQSNPYRPFCSQRCKMVDLGAWANEAYRIPVAENKDRPSTEDPEGAA